MCSVKRFEAYGSISLLHAKSVKVSKIRDNWSKALYSKASNIPMIPFSETTPVEKEAQLSFQKIYMTKPW